MTKTKFLIHSAFYIFITSLSAFAQNNPAFPTIYYDADSVSANDQKQSLTIKGNAYILSHDMFIRADEIFVSYADKKIKAEGHVQLFRKKDRVLCDLAEINTETHETKALGVQFYADSLYENKNLEEDVLGLSEAEVLYENARTQRVGEIREELKMLREKYVSLKNLESLARAPSSQNSQMKEIQERYAQLLARLTRTSRTENIFLAKMPSEKKKLIVARRESLKKISAQNEQRPFSAGQTASVPGYLSVKAEKLFITKDGKYTFFSAHLSSCRCDSDEKKVWQFSSQRADIEPDRYATLSGATVDILETPVAYSPWLKIPIKSKRESGFLFPNFYLSNSGQAMTIPYFLVYNDHADSTFSLSQFVDRGYRYDLENRVQISPNSAINVYTEYMREDELHLKEYEDEERKIQTKIDEGKLKTNYAKDLEVKNAGQVRKERWLGRGAWNIPVFSYASLKANGEFVSDNRYIYDFSSTSTNPSPLIPARNPKRFLAQEAAAEYYGSDFTLSARVQGSRDLMAPETTDTPKRIPKVEFVLLPKRYFNLPFSLDQYASWERVSTLGGQRYIDVAQKDLEIPNATSKHTIEVSSNVDGIRNPLEPFIEGERVYSQSRLALPLPANNYVTSWFAVRGVSSQYYFPQAAPFGKTQPYQTYVSYDTFLAIPFNARAQLFRSNGENFGMIRHDLVPYAFFQVIPKVTRDEQFPTRARLWYAEENVYRIKKLTLGISSEWFLQRDDPIVRTETLQRFDEDLPVALEKFRSDDYMQWANKELETYLIQSRTKEFDKKLLWPSDKRSVSTKKFEMRPLRLNIATDYNFDIKQTEEDVTSRLNVGETPPEIMPWGDVTLSVRWSAQPLLNLSGYMDAVWGRKLQRWDEWTSGVSMYLGYGISSGIYTRYKLRAHTINQNNNAILQRDDYPNFDYDRKVAYHISYAPLKWLTFAYERSSEVDVNSRLQPSELEYASKQTIVFNRVQDCMDIILQRRKDRNVEEKYALWALGINVTFGGYERPLPDYAQTFPDMQSSFKRETGI